MRKISILVILVLGFLFIGCGENSNFQNQDKGDPLSKMLNSNQEEE